MIVTTISASCRWAVFPSEASLGPRTTSQTMDFIKIHGRAGSHKHRTNTAAWKLSRK